MERAIQERIQVKTRDSQLFEIFVNHFEFSPKQKLLSIQRDLRPGYSAFGGSRRLSLPQRTCGDFRSLLWDTGLLTMVEPAGAIQTVMVRDRDNVCTNFCHWD
ncbi:MAG: hypothetical protein A4E55_00139 [Pelotomaculum sp. PtaU1.Bin035]|nr:MAG: hypothetical protein A4E55_00139 [Pelotomaculum sp. PtaU1.Bin035]